MVIVHKETQLLSIANVFDSVGKCVEKQKVLKRRVHSKSLEYISV